jgi:hypothetical protein
MIKPFPQRTLKSLLFGAGVTFMAQEELAEEIREEIGKMRGCATRRTTEYCTEGKIFQWLRILKVFAFGQRPHQRESPAFPYMTTW